jgi:sugar O-acyltransferase (sialic acid O-acetyltransferase NeuD family)
VIGDRTYKEDWILDKLILFGNKTMARGMYLGLRNSPKYEVVGFTVDRDYLDGDRFCDLPIVPFDVVRNVFPPENHKMHIAVGFVANNKIRAERYLAAKEMAYEMVSFISSTTLLDPKTIGDHCLVGEYCIISSTAKIGNNVTISGGCIIAEDVVIGDHCFFSGGVAVAGGARIGTGCYLGIRSIIRNRITIGNHCVIGAGALMLENAEDNTVYLGEPATLLPISSDKLPLG